MRMFYQRDLLAHLMIDHNERVRHMLHSQRHLASAVRERSDLFTGARSIREGG